MRSGRGSPRWAGTSAATTRLPGSTDCCSPRNWPSLDAVDPALVRDLRAGDVIPDGPPGTAAYVVAEVRPPEVLVLRSTTHVPPGWDAHGAAISWTWCLRLSALDTGATRVHLRVRAHMAPWWFAGLYVAALVPGDLVMATGMLRGIRARAEEGAPSRASGRAPYAGAGPRQ